MEIDKETTEAIRKRFRLKLIVTMKELHAEVLQYGCAATIVLIGELAKVIGENVGITTSKSDITHEYLQHLVASNIEQGIEDFYKWLSDFKERN